MLSVFTNDVKAMSGQFAGDAEMERLGVVDKEGNPDSIEFVSFFINIVINQELKKKRLSKVVRRHNDRCSSLYNAFIKHSSRYKVKSETLIPQILKEEDKLHNKTSNLLAALLSGTKLAKANQIAGPTKVNQKL